MPTVEAIEKEIVNLSIVELNELRHWFDQFDNELWDSQIESDAESGKLNDLAQEALFEYKSGKAKGI